MTARRKKEILIAAVLVFALLLGVVAMLLIEDGVGIPTYYDGEMVNIKVSITEICSSNGSIISTDDGETPDYIELYNDGETFNLADFGLCNDVTNSVKYTFGDLEFKSKTYMVIYLDGTNIPFKLNSSGGEYISLVSWDGTVIAKATTVAAGSNRVMVLEGNEYVISDTPSPGYPNTPQGVADFLAGDKDKTNDLVINEVFTANRNTLPDFQGDFCDIIEIKNISSAAISTKGYFVSDTVTNRTRYKLPELTLAPQQILLVFASGKDTVAENGEIHADFRLSAGETAVLSKGNSYCSAEVAQANDGLSLARVITQSGIEYQTMAATPGFENDEAGIEQLELARVYADAPLVINELLFSSDELAFGGKLRDVIELCNVSDKEISTKGWYISDSEDDPYKFAIPEYTLAPNQCVLLYADKSGMANSTGFALSSGERLFLTAPDYRRSAYVSCLPAGEGNSRSRYIENGEEIYIDGEISIGFTNDAAGIKSYAAAVRPAEIEISEVVARNESYIAGPYKTYHDFVEIYNRTDEDIDLTGWFLSDDSLEPMKASLNGIVIPAHEYLVIILSSEGINTPKGYPVVKFGISSQGENIVLSKGDTIIDMAIIPSMGADTAYGRPNGEDGFSILEEPTPEKENSMVALKVASAPAPSIPQGVYKQDTVTVELKSQGNVYYTLDSSKPSTASTLYTAPLVLDKTTVIRCISVEQGKQKSEIVNLTYIINEPDHLETVAIVTTPSNLFDHYSGIYATGPNADSVFPYNGANYYMGWEREANISFFADDGTGFSENCGIKIFGGLSKALEKKSLAFFFRSKYGKGQLNYKLFEDSDLDVYESVILRNTGQDWKLSTMRDAMMTKLASDYLKLDVQNCRPVVVYINGEYWGIYFIREKLNDQYVAGHYNVSAEEANVTFANGRNNDEYQTLLNFAKQNDLSKPENYEHIKTLMDVENYADYIVTEIIVGNADNGNIKFFTYKGGKWRWMLYDVDHGFRSATHNTVEAHLNPAGTGASDMFSTALINSLLKNPDFKKMFLEEIAYQLNSVWNTENITKYIDRFKGYIENDIMRDCQRWNHSYSAWENAIDSLYYFANNREGYLVDYVQDYFNLSDNEMQQYGFKV